MVEITLDKLARIPILANTNDPRELKFARFDTPHIFVAEFYKGRGWVNARLVRYGYLHIDPKSIHIHYGIAGFEGMKMFREGNNAFLWRPYTHAQRFQNTAHFGAMPPVPEDRFVEFINELVHEDGYLIPERRSGAFGYIRPAIFANERKLGVDNSAEFVLCITLSPAASYFSKETVDLMVGQYRRVPAGPLGSAKLAAGYANSMYWLDMAKKRENDQVLFLDPNMLGLITETGATNFGWVENGTLYTPPAHEYLLNGVTRRGFLEILPENGVRVKESDISLEGLIDGVKRGAIKEAVTMGTATNVGFVGNLDHTRYEKSARQVIPVEDRIQVYRGAPGELQAYMLELITCMQLGDTPAHEGWLVPVELKIPKHYKARLLLDYYVRRISQGKIGLFG